MDTVQVGGKVKTIRNSYRWMLRHRRDIVEANVLMYSPSERASHGNECVIYVHLDDGRTILTMNYGSLALALALMQRFSPRVTLLDNKECSTFGVRSTSTDIQRRIENDARSEHHRVTQWLKDSESYETSLIDNHTINHFVQHEACCANCGRYYVLQVTSNERGENQRIYIAIASGYYVCPKRLRNPVISNPILRGR